MQSDRITHCAVIYIETWMISNFRLLHGLALFVFLCRLLVPSYFGVKFSIAARSI